MCILYEGENKETIDPSVTQMMEAMNLQITHQFLWRNIRLHMFRCNNALYAWFRYYYAIVMQMNKAPSSFKSQISRDLMLKPILCMSTPIQ